MNWMQNAVLFLGGFLVGIYALYRFVVVTLMEELKDTEEKLVKALKAEDELARENSRLRKLVNPNAGIVQASPKGRWTA